MGLAAESSNENRHESETPVILVILLTLVVPDILRAHDSADQQTPEQEQMDYYEKNEHPCAGA